MSNWVSVIVLLAIVIAVALWRERSRVSGIEKWMEGRSFKRVFPVPAGGPQPAAELVALMSIHGARIWGMVLEGTLDGVSVTVAEHESSVPGKKTGVWFTIATWPSGDTRGRIVMHKGKGSKLIGDAAAAIANAVKEPMLDALGVSLEPEGPHVETPGGWTVYGEPIVRDRWLTPEKMRELDAWTHGGSFVREDGQAGWRAEGNISLERLEQLPGQLATARRLLQ